MGCDDNKQQLGKLTAPERNRYYYGKLLDERNLQLEQDHINRKRWLVNRLGLGEGVLCGLEVTAGKDGSQLCISRGVAVDALGREIIVPQPWCFDPWKITDECGQVIETLSPEKSHDIQICLAYSECYADYAPMLVADCNAREQCEPGTIRESFRVMVKDVTDKPPSRIGVDEKLCETLRVEAKDASERRQHVCEYTTGACATPPEETCVMLAVVTLNAGDKKNPQGTIGAIKTCEYRRPLYSNSALSDMIMCLAGRAGAGAPGKDGLGLDPNLPKIIDIAWDHGGDFSFVKFREIFLNVFNEDRTVNRNAVIEKIIKSEEIPVLTIFFNKKMSLISREMLTVRLKQPLAIPTGNEDSPMRFFGIYLNLELYGEIVQVDNRMKRITPHTKEEYACAVTFIPCYEAFLSILPTLIKLGWCAQHYLALAPPALHITLKGDFIWSPNKDDKFSEGGVLDADNIGGQVGKDMDRPGVKEGAISGGKNPSGNLTQGGDFESWLNLPLPKEIPIEKIGCTQYFGRGLDVKTGDIRVGEMPVSVNFADKSHFTDAGFSGEQIKKIIEERRKGPFLDEQDLRKRIKISDDSMNKLRSKMVML
jgi:hypothetical protein